MFLASELSWRPRGFLPILAMLAVGCAGFEAFPDPASAPAAGAEQGQQAGTGIIRVGTHDPGGRKPSDAAADGAAFDGGGWQDSVGLDLVWWDAGTSADSWVSTPDAQTEDAGAPAQDADAGSAAPDALVDSGELIDAGGPDVGATDAGPADAGLTDAGLTEAGPIDVGGQDALIEDAAGADALAGLDATPQDVGPDTAGPTPELCNKLDDNGDGRIDEGCHPGPNLRPGQTWTDLGAVTQGYGLLPSWEHTVTIDAQHPRAVLVARDLEPKSWLVWADRLQGPDGKSWLDHAGWATAPNRGGYNLSLSSLLLGASPALTPVAGSWKFGFARTNDVPATAQEALPGWMHLGAVASPPLTSALAAIDLDVYLVAGKPFAAKDGATSPVWNAMRKRVEEVWSAAGLKVGAVTFTDILGVDGEKYLFVDDIGDIGAANELVGLMALSAKLRPTSTAVSIYLVETLESEGVPVAAGLTGQLGGVAGMQGSRLGGLALAMPADQLAKALAADPSAKLAGDHYGAVLAHELGHFLGLWHTVEKDGKLVDPVPDTAACTPPAGTKVYDAKVCPNAAKNLMFWGSGAPTVSAGQVTVVRRHPALRALP